MSQKDDRSFPLEAGDLGGDPLTNIHFPLEEEGESQWDVCAQTEEDLAMVNSRHGNEASARAIWVACLKNHREFPLWGEAVDAPRSRIFYHNAPCDLGEVQVGPNLVPSTRGILVKVSSALRLVNPARDGRHSRNQSMLDPAADGVGVTQGCGQNPSSALPG